MKNLIALTIITGFLVSCGSKLSDEDKELADRKFNSAIALINDTSYQKAIDTLNTLIDDNLFVSKAKLLKSGALLAMNETTKAWDVYTSRLDFLSNSKVNLEVNKWPVPPPKTVSSGFFVMLNKKKKICNSILKYDFGKKLPIIHKIQNDAIRSYEKNSELP